MKLNENKLDELDEGGTTMDKGTRGGTTLDEGRTTTDG